MGAFAFEGRGVFGRKGFGGGEKPIPKDFDGNRPGEKR